MGGLDGPVDAADVDTPTTKHKPCMLGGGGGGGGEG